MGLEVRQLDRPGRIRLMACAVLLVFLLGPVGTGLGAAVDDGKVGLGAFAMLVFPCGLLLREIGKQAEHLALGMKGRPWLGGRMTLLQKLILQSERRAPVTCHGSGRMRRHDGVSESVTLCSINS